MDKAQQPVRRKRGRMFRKIRQVVSNIVNATRKQRRATIAPRRAGGFGAYGRGSRTRQMRKALSPVWRKSRTTKGQHRNETERKRWSWYAKRVSDSHRHTPKHDPGKVRRRLASTIRDNTLREQATKRSTKRLFAIMAQADKRRAEREEAKAS